MTQNRAFLIRFVREESGQDLIEYGLLIGVITASVVMTLTAISTKIQEYYNNLNANMSGM